MTFKRFLGIGIATIIYGLCTVGWADVKPIDPAKECLTNITVDPATALANYKQYAQYLDGRYVLCFNPMMTPYQTAASISFAPNSADLVVIYDLKLTAKVSEPLFPASKWMGKFLLSINSNNVLLQNVQFTGPGNAIAGSIGVVLSGSGHAIINGTISGFETAVKANCLDSSPGALNDKVNCTIGPKTVTDNVKYGVVVPTTGQGVTITQNEIRTIADPYATGITQKIVLQGVANGGLTPPIFSIDPATMTIWKTLSADGKFATEIGGVLPKAGAIELFEHYEKMYPDGSKVYTDYFRASCPTAQNDKGQFEFKCTGLNISAKDGIIFTNVTYTPNTSAMTKWINVKDIPDKQITAAVNPGATISGGSLSDPPSAPPAGDGGMVVGGAGETVAMNDGGPTVGNASLPHPDPLPSDEGNSNSDSGGGGTAAAMTGSAMALGGEAAPAAVGASAGCGGQLMPEKTPLDPILFVILLMPIVILLQVRWNKGG